MALSYIVDPLIEHQNRAGVNNVDGWFEVFLQDTDDHAEVYLDFEGTRAPEQIRIDNNGRAVMIAEENVPYRVEMYDATGNLIYTQYPVYTMASGGGQLVTNLESTNGTVKVNRTSVGSVVNYDLSVMDNDLTALPWLRCSGSTSMSGNVYRPEYVEGVMAVGSRGIVLRGGQYYHVDVHAQCTKGSPVEYYDTVTVELVKEGEEDVPVTVASTAWVVDCTTSSTESVGLSADVMANADCELVVKITPTLANQNTFALTDVSAHRVYTGLPWRTEGGGLELGETATTAYRGDRGKAAYDHSLVTSGNPHNVTKGDVGLGNVENKSGAALKTEFTGAVTEGGTGFPTGGDVYTALSGKVDKEQGKGLSTNDFTDSLKTKLEGIQNRAAAQGGQDDSLVTTGDKFFWNSWDSDDYEVPVLEQVVTIGGRAYPYVQIGNVLCLAENLDFKFQGLIVDNVVSTSPQACYYNNDESTYGVDGNRYGILYNGYAAYYMYSHASELFPDGWNLLPDNGWYDFLNQLTSVGYNNASVLKSTTGWENNANGTDDYGFNLKPAGFRYGHAATFAGLGTTAYVYQGQTQSNQYSEEYYACDPYTNGVPTSGDKRQCNSVRLFKILT